MADVKYYQDRVCACGCGEKIMVSRWHEYGRGIPRFIHGHNSKIENPNPKKFSHQQEEEIIQKYNEGLTGNVLAEEYGTTPTTIWRIFKRRGIPMRNLSDAHRKYSFNPCS